MGMDMILWNLRERTLTLATVAPRIWSHTHTPSKSVPQSTYEEPAIRRRLRNRYVYPGQKEKLTPLRLENILDELSKTKINTQKFLKSRKLFYPHYFEDVKIISLHESISIFLKVFLYVDAVHPGLAACLF